MFSKLSFKAKILIPLVLMSLGLVTLSILVINQFRTQLYQAKGLAKASDVILDMSAFVHELQKERARSVLFLNKKVAKSEVDAQRTIVDEKIASVEISVTNFNFEPVRQKNTKAIQELKQIRVEVDSEKVQPALLAKKIGDLIDRWIMIQVSCANEYHLKGYETGLISTSIFEKSKENMGRLRAALNVVLGFDNPITPTAIANLSGNITGIMENFNSPGLSISDESREKVKAILESEDWKSVLSTYGTVVDKSGTGKYEIEPKKFSDTITRVIDKLRDVMSDEIKQGNLLIKSTESQASASFAFSLISIISLILFSLTLSFIIINSVNKTLLATVTGITAGAETVFSISTKIADASQSLSASSTEQAAALQQTTSAIEETSAMITKNAENAKRSSEMSEKSQSTASLGQNSVRDMIQSIGEISDGNNDILKQIEKSNSEISEIIQLINAIGDKTKVINDIVFQTKLLSFNASVEAARAGEHGKGFSVVAEEVGNLAQMSGNSAKEISELLDSSTKKVEDIIQSMVSSVGGMIDSAATKVQIGTQTVQRCEQVLNEIVDNVSQVNKLVAEISFASEEQSRGVEEINKAMVELDSTAQQNNRSSQQASVSAEELKAQVINLKDMVKNLNGVIYGQ